MGGQSGLRKAFSALVPRYLLYLLTCILYSPPDAPTAATMWIRTADRRFGYSTQSHSYLDFGKAYLGGGQPAKMNKQTEENSTDWVDSNLFFNQDGSSSDDRGVGAVHKSSS